MMNLMKMKYKLFKKIKLKTFRIKLINKFQIKTHLILFRLGMNQINNLTNA